MPLGKIAKEVAEDMKSALQLNTDILKREKIALWNVSPTSQEILWYLMNLDIYVYAFCMENITFDVLMGKKVLSVHELIGEKSFALIVPIQDYKKILDKYVPYGLMEKDVFAWIDARRDLMYF